MVGDRMARSKSARANKAMGFLSRLRRDVRGNTLAIVAAAMIPLIAMVGGGIDVSRMYLAKVRLQHACDAGALAGRKTMGAGTWAQTSPNPNTTAQQFFDGNFRSGAYGTTGLSRSYSENSGDVSGTASATVPMTLMKFFGMPSRTMTVVCDAQMQLPNTDVMFVLDNTGSMADKPDGSSCSSGNSACKIAVLKNAVKCFYESVAQLKTNGTCPTATSGNGVNSSSQIRFGFVPYSENVNVGQILLAANSSWLANSASYDTRQFVKNNASFPSSSQTIISGSFNCGDAPTSNTYTQYTWATSHGNCSNLQVKSKTVWNYDFFNTDVSSLKTTGTVTLPVGDGGTNATITWDGCIEERLTVRTNGNPTDFQPIPSGATDLDIDTPPTSDPNTQWKPALPGLIFPRGSYDVSSWTTNSIINTTNIYLNSSGYACPAPAQKLQVWSDPAVFDTYVDSLQPAGNTYHDIGMLWGARLMSPTGLFKSENAFTKTGGQIARNLIFMTDGDTNVFNTDYDAYGMPWFDRRQTAANQVPTSDTSSTTGTLGNQVNLRFAALCEATKNKGINLWVISFGSGVASDTKTRLQNCATDSSHYFDATDSTSLSAAFQQIAAQITQLRLTK